jgi:chemotaxis protein CheD
VTTEREVVLQIGGVLALREPTIIKTVVGSCIAVCIADPAAHVGGMNHFMLPAPNGRDDPHDRARFGVHAMDLLIGAMQKAGADRRRLVAKVFGGAHVLVLPESAGSVPERNIRFIEEFLAVERIPVASWDVGGHLPRRIHFHTATATAWVKRLGGGSVSRARAVERAHLATMRRSTPRTGTLALFDPLDEPAG